MDRVCGANRSRTAANVLKKRCRGTPGPTGRGGALDIKGLAPTEREGVRRNNERALWPEQRLERLVQLALGPGFCLSPSRGSEATQVDVHERHVASGEAGPAQGAPPPP